MTSGLLITVSRDACCAQDDQLGPLKATYELETDATLADLVAAVTRSKFLQFSSSHTTLNGAFGGTPVVRVFSESYLPGRAPEFKAPPTTLVRELLAQGPMTFRF